MAGIYTPTPFQNALFDPRKPLQQLAEKKCPCALARARASCARGKLHYGIISGANSAPLYVVTVAGDAQVVQRAITAIVTALATEWRTIVPFVQFIKLLFVLSPLGLSPVTKV